ncbi:MAG: SlyX family protein [Opitutaceae bacterium]|nr:SlyX family protein [Opitutaceae bacterium]
MSDIERLIQLEERYAFLEHHVAEQDKAILRFSEEVTKLQLEIAGLRSLLAAAAESDDDALPDDRPPHY